MFESFVCEQRAVVLDELFLKPQSGAQAVDPKWNSRQIQNIPSNGLCCVCLASSVKNKGKQTQKKRGTKIGIDPRVLELWIFFWISCVLFVHSFVRSFVLLGVFAIVCSTTEDLFSPPLSIHLLLETL